MYVDSIYDMIMKIILPLLKIIYMHDNDMI